MGDNLVGSIERAASSLGVALDPAVTSAAGVWLERLTEWNARTDLTAARSHDHLVDLMLADALVLSRVVPSGARVVDVGTGAGAPGLALALLRPDLRLTLVEPLRKRASFLRTVIGLLGRMDVHIEPTRAEVLAGRLASDVAVSRATFPPAEWLALGARLVGPGGSVWALLAREDPPVREGAAVEEDVAYAWPLTGVPRRAVRYRLAV
ncbi:MAG TPA: RsmG family class I SAM-dependent methyltransferase [Polyangiaceae bacterium]|nr:RsmG family class I SAM-dependent methyltransferase [Polyangiaceae bacterium]